MDDGSYVNADEVNCPADQWGMLLPFLRTFYSLHNYSWLNQCGKSFPSYPVLLKESLWLNAVKTSLERVEHTFDGRRGNWHFPKQIWPQFPKQVVLNCFSLGFRSLFCWISPASPIFLFSFSSVGTFFLVHFSQKGRRAAVSTGETNYLPNGWASAWIHWRFPPTPQGSM